MVKTMKIKELQDALAKNALKGFYDNRGPASFAQLHIKGSTNLPVADAVAGKGLPADKAAMLVFY
ncbi:hypothetical protein PLCT1_01264 [Planctomycetaceae bacterium]|nr:hypothetical protein PLCT1_01264 [Planctomycetaceae bacterium]